MLKNGKEERLIRLIHRNLLFLVILVAVVAVVILNLNRKGLLGPIRGGQINHYFLQWKVSDHSTTGGSDNLLLNQLDGTDEPEYARENVVLQLNRNGDGSLTALPRLQGKLEYRSTSSGH